MSIIVNPVELGGIDASFSFRESSAGERHDGRKEVAHRCRSCNYPDIYGAGDIFGRRGVLGSRNAQVAPEARGSLEEALKTSEQEGKPISAEYDVEDGDFQISVYVERDGHFRKVIVDPKSGTINTTKPITDPREVDEAQAQSAALSNTKLPLTTALATAVDSNRGYRAVSVIPLPADDEAVVTNTLMKGEAMKQIAQKLN